MKSYIVVLFALIACATAMPADGTMVRAYDSAMRMPINMGKTGVQMGRSMAGTMDNLLKNAMNPLTMISAVIPAGQNAASNMVTQFTEQANSVMSQGQNMANGISQAAMTNLDNTMDSANKMAQQVSATTNNALGQAINSANQGAQMAQNFWQNTMKGFQNMKPRSS